MEIVVPMEEGRSDFLKDGSCQLVKMLKQWTDCSIGMRTPNIAIATVILFLLTENQQKNAEQDDEKPLRQG